MIEHSALILIEFQQEWLDQDGKLHSLMQDRKQFQFAIKSAKDVLETARQCEMKIVHCGLSFQNGYPELGKAQHGLREAIARYCTFPSNEKGSQSKTLLFLKRDNLSCKDGRVVVDLQGLTLTHTCGIKE